MYFSDVTRKDRSDISFPSAERRADETDNRCNNRLFHHCATTQVCHDKACVSNKVSVPSL